MNLKYYLQKKLMVSSKEAQLIESTIKEYIKKKKSFREMEDDYEDEDSEFEAKELASYMEDLEQAYNPSSEAMKKYKSKYYEEDFAYFQEYWFNLKRNPNRDWSYTLKSIISDFEGILDRERTTYSYDSSIISGDSGDNRAEKLCGIRLYYDWLTAPNNSILKGNERRFLLEQKRKRYL